MKLLTYALLFNSVKVPVDTQQNINILLCEYDIDCDLPMRCCSGFIFDYCCDIGGGLKKNRQKFPNITIPKIPELLPDRIPNPIPVPT